MSYLVRFTEGAVRDQPQANLYYENLRSGLGDAFLEEIRTFVKQLEINPAAYGFSDARSIMRDGKLNRFPYLLFFEVRNTEVVIFRVFNTFRNPTGLFDK